MRIGGIALILFAAACGSSSSASNYGDFQQQGRKLICQNQVSCGRLDGAYESACEQGLASGGTPDPSTFSFDSSAAGGCLDAFKKVFSSCTKVSFADMMLTDACKSVITGKTPVGGSCPFGVECVPGSTCLLSFSNTSCTSKCVALGNVGDACTSGGTCVAGAYCDFGTMKCKATLDSGATCSGSLQCKSGLFCVGTMMTCSAPAGSGAPCAEYEPQSCTGDLICEVASKTCVSVKQMGAACSSDDECANPMICFNAGGTSTMGTCQPLAGKGASCTTTRCIAPYQCTNGTCVVLPDIGQACTTQCLTGYCNKTSMKCEALLAVGATCDPSAASQPCQSPSFCDGPTMVCRLCQ
jgi:hypothetical protein